MGTWVAYSMPQRLVESSLRTDSDVLVLACEGNFTLAVDSPRKG